ncbi:MAG: hypothetical protein LBP35_05390 [Candidatus Ancillula trichonymphae]|nr:hypothetical protein [Candidatus Ancillula trichonymphae]
MTTSKQVVLVVIIGKGTIGKLFGKVIEKTTRNEYVVNYITRADSAEERSDKLKNAAIIMLAVKPKDLDGVLDEVKEYAQERATICSFVAGVDSSAYAQKLGESARLVLVVPNTTTEVELGFASITRTLGAEPEDVQSIKKVLSSATALVDLEESKVDEFTAVAGCAPAYFLRFAKVLQSAAEDLGIGAEDATTFVANTMTGVGLMMQGSPDEHKSIEQLINEVASEGGATEKAMQSLDSSDFNAVIKNAVTSAYQHLKS